jgi:putative protease
MFHERVFRSKWVAWGVVGAVSLMLFPCGALAQVKSGAVMGFIYSEDMKSPVEGAVVKLCDVQNGKELQSGPTDKNGMYALKGVAEGRYVIGVTSTAGDFNFDYELLVKANETAKLALALTPGVPAKNEKLVEKRIGSVVGFSVQTGEAEVFLEQGDLKIGDQIHVKGVITDFYQAVKSLKIKGEAVKEVPIGSHCLLAVEKPAVVGDIVYVVSKRPEPAGARSFFTKPLGIAVIVSAAALLVYGGLTVVGVEGEKSPAKK